MNYDGSLSDCSSLKVAPTHPWPVNIQRGFTAIGSTISLEIGFSIQFLAKKTSPERTMGSLNDCQFRLVTITKKACKKLGLVTWGAALQQSQLMTVIASLHCSHNLRTTCTVKSHVEVELRSFISRLSKITTPMQKDLSEIRTGPHTYNHCHIPTII